MSDAATVYAGTGDLSVFGRSNYAGAKVYGAGGTVTLDGDTGNITYYGGALANTVFSKLNRDTLIGGTGHMTVIGGSGETIIGGSGGLDFFSPDGGGANAISTAAGSVNTLRLAGSATVESWGTDTIFGGTDNSIFNLHGNAILNGSSGNGTITISGDATIYGAGQDRVEVTQGARATIYTGVLETVNETNAWVRLISGQASVTVSGGKATVSSGAYLPISVSTSGDGPVSISASVGMAEIMSRGADLIHGGSGGAKIQARGANAQIWGEEGHLWVTGGTNDTITGGNGADVLTGGLGADTFVYGATNQSGIGIAVRDVITDFLSGTDRLNFAGIDANTTTGGNQAFTFNNIENAAISAAGQLVYHYEGIGASEITVIQGNVNNNLGADFEVALTGHITFNQPTDIVL